MTKHLHVWTRSLDGSEFGNALYYNEIDAAVDFLGIARGFMYNSGADLHIEDVYNSLSEGSGMYAGSPGLIVVISRCEQQCQSPVWN